MTRRALLLRGAALAAASLAGPWFIRDARAADTPRFGCGIASGSPTASAVVLWTRLTGERLPPEVPVAWELAEDARFTRIVARGSETAREADAHTVHAEPAGLPAGRAFFYRFRALGQQSPAGRTRTAPAPDAPVERLDFAIASCQRWDTGHYAAWRDVVDGEPDLVLFLGDYLYEYPSSPTSLRRHRGGVPRTLAEYRERHAQYREDPLLQAAHAACPWIVTWDDHEVDNDYAGLEGAGLQRDFPARRAAAYQAWWEHLPLPNALRPVDGRIRVHGRLDWGRLARLHWLDNRQHRDRQACPPPIVGGARSVEREACAELADPRRTLLGPAQEQWLAEGWTLERPWNLLAQQTLMAPFGGERVWTDGWDGYPAARQRLLQTLARRRVPGAVVLGGDIHFHAVADLKADFDDARSPVVASEFCGTSISSLSRRSAESLAAAQRALPHLRYARADRRGSIRFTLTSRELRADLRGVVDAADPASPAESLARFVVDAKRPGPQPA